MNVGPSYVRDGLVHWVLEATTLIGGPRGVRHVDMFVVAFPRGEDPVGGMHGSEWRPVPGGGPFEERGEAESLLDALRLAAEVVES